MEENISRKFTIAVVTILVIILVTNDFSDFSGEVVKKIAVTKCFDSDGGSTNQRFIGGYAKYGTTYIADKCWPDSPWVSSNMILEAVCRGDTFADTDTVTCVEGCVKGRNGAYCKQAPIKSLKKK